MRRTFGETQAMPTAAELFDQALRYHQGGDLGLAEHLYRQTLQANPQHAEAWNLLGLLAIQVGRADVAAEYIIQALRIKPGLAEAHINLGIVLRGQGKLTEAEACYREAIRSKPDYAEAHNNLGNVLRDQGKFQEAEASFRQALCCRPDYAQAHNNLGVLLSDQDRPVEAEACYREALRLRPDYAEAHSNLGYVLHQQGNLEEAEACCRQALRLIPGYAEAHNNLGNILHDQARLADAETCYREALRLRPHYAEAHNNLGNVLWAQGKLAEALVECREALRLKPAYAEAYNNVGNILQDQAKLEEAEAGFREAIRLRPDYAEAHTNFGYHWLLRGDFAQGWPEYEWRRQTKDNVGAAAPPPGWDGSALNGQTILLRTEQGLGDTFQFVRYARLVKAQGGRVVLQCQHALARILTACPGIDQVVEAGAPLPAYDLTAPLLSLPLLCKTTLETIPAEVPYLAVDPARIHAWRARLADLPGFKVGICWQGNPKLKRDRLRSVSLASFAPLAEVPGVCLIALQRGPGLEQIEQQTGGLRVVDLPGRSEDPAEGWLDSAALIQALDLVISVDTAVAHLAGALAAPAWVVLPFVPDWRWLINREDSPWYPTLRLFRQRKQGDWPQVFQHMAAALQQRVATRETTCLQERPV
jgi:Flp pilus assembly protein TadD